MLYLRRSYLITCSPNTQPIQPPTLANSQPSTDDRSPEISQKLAIPLPQPCRVRGSNPILAPLSAVAFVRFAWFVHRWAISPLCRLKLRSAQNNLEPMIDRHIFSAILYLLGRYPKRKEQMKTTLIIAILTPVLLFVVSGQIVLTLANITAILLISGLATATVLMICALTIDQKKGLN